MKKTSNMHTLDDLRNTFGTCKENSLNGFSEDRIVHVLVFDRFHHQCLKMTCQKELTEAKLKIYYEIIKLSLALKKRYPYLESSLTVSCSNTSG